MGESVETVDGVGWKGCEPFEGKAFEGGGEGFAKDRVLGCVAAGVEAAVCLGWVEGK